MVKEEHWFGKLRWGYTLVWWDEMRCDERQWFDLIDVWEDNLQHVKKQTIFSDNCSFSGFPFCLYISFLILTPIYYLTHHTCLQSHLYILFAILFFKKNIYLFSFSPTSPPLKPFFFLFFFLFNNLLRWWIIYTPPTTQIYPSFSRTSLTC